MSAWLHILYRVVTILCPVQNNYDNNTIKSNYLFSIFNPTFRNLLVLRFSPSQFRVLHNFVEFRELCFFIRYISSSCQARWKLYRTWWNSFLATEITERYIPWFLVTGNCKRKGLFYRDEFTWKTSVTNETRSRWNSTKFRATAKCY